jgi:hypothetical protein
MATCDDKNRDDGNNRRRSKKENQEKQIAQVNLIDNDTERDDYTNLMVFGTKYRY